MTVAGVLGINLGGNGVTFQCFYCPVSSADQNLVINHVAGKHPGKELKIKRIPRPVNAVQSVNNNKDVRIRYQASTQLRIIYETNVF